MAALLSGYASTQQTWNDCDPKNDRNDGPFGPMIFLNATTSQGHPVYGLIPTKDSDDRKFPLIGFNHGSTG
jgi:hypothetical protein